METRWSYYPWCCYLNLDQGDMGDTECWGINKHKSMCGVQTIKFKMLTLGSVDVEFKNVKISTYHAFVFCWGWVFQNDVDCRLCWFVETGICKWNSSVVLLTVAMCAGIKGHTSSVPISISIVRSLLGDCSEDWRLYFWVPIYHKEEKKHPSIMPQISHYRIASIIFFLYCNIIDLLGTCI